LTTRAIVLGASSIIAVGLIMLVLLLAFFGSGSARDQARLDAFRTAGTTVVGIGGAVALLLAARRQRTTELTLELQQDVAANAAHDADERRFTEVYSKAADQLGNDKAPVRLAGLYAMERLGQANPPQRQMIVNVVCAYLRMPFVAGIRPVADASAAVYAEHRDWSQEQQVRMAALHVLFRHRNPEAARLGNDWDVWLDLDNARLDEAELSGMDLAGASLYRATLARADLSDVNLQDSDLTAADLAGANLRGSRLRNSTLDDADLTDADLTGADLTNVLLTRASWSARTTWPDEAIAALVAAASQPIDGNRVRVGDLRLN
jgi:hypothetical protein